MDGALRESNKRSEIQSTCSSTYGTPWRIRRYHYASFLHLFVAQREREDSIIRSSICRNAEDCRHDAVDRAEQCKMRHSGYGNSSTLILAPFRPAYTLRRRLCATSIGQHQKYLAQRAHIIARDHLFGLRRDPLYCVLLYDRAELLKGSTASA